MVASEGRVLIVDDETVFAQNIAKILSKRGFQTELAADGLNALAVIGGQAAFDVVLLDVRMPGLDGIQVLRRIRKMAPEVEVIVLTGQATVENGIEAVRAGAFDYLPKPFEINELVEKVQSARAAKRIRNRPILWPRCTAGDVILHAFVRLAANDRLSAALTLFNSDMRKMAGEMLYICDANGVLAGGVTRQVLTDAARKAHPGKSIIWEDLRNHPEWLPEVSIGEVMHGPVEAAAIQTPLMRIARHLIDNNYQSMPVTDGNRLVGIVRRLDVLKYIDQEDVDSQDVRSESV